MVTLTVELVARRIVIALIGMLCWCSAALAVPVKIDFTGQAFTTPFPPIPTGPYPAIGSVAFDTDLGTLTRDAQGVYTFSALDPQNFFPVFYASLYYDMGIYSGEKFNGLGGGSFDGYFALFQFNPADVTALNLSGSNGSGSSIHIGNGISFIQYGGPCGSYCAFINIETVTIHAEGLSVLAVPGPIVGAGLPGSLMAVAFIIWLRVRRALVIDATAAGG